MDPLPSDWGMKGAELSVDGQKPALRSANQRWQPGSGWRDPVLSDLERSRDLPLFLRPNIELVGRWRGAVVEVALRATTRALAIRWEAQGEVAGQGARATWVPAGEDDRLVAAIHSEGGVAFRSLGVREVQR